MARAQNVKSDIAYRKGRQGYVVGFGLAAVLTVIPFLLVGGGVMPRIDLLWIIGALGLVQVVVHIRYFLHVDLSAEHREELLLLLFSGTLLVLMIAGMLWMLFNMYGRMM